MKLSEKFKTDIIELKNNQYNRKLNNKKLEILRANIHSYIAEYLEIRIPEIEKLEKDNEELIIVLKDIIGYCWGVGQDEQEEALTKGKILLEKITGKKWEDVK